MLKERSRSTCKILKNGQYNPTRRILIILFYCDFF
ncbi:hypothetical protein CASFOL_025818 [Castilleja foliolosa]|uniref:Uncharacterized protein n=1 Tax=Castilleja foliolosa TaxID=1961234 RepID=A0ABD3CTD8_9LAMI